MRVEYAKLAKLKIYVDNIEQSFQAIGQACFYPATSSELALLSYARIGIELVDGIKKQLHHIEEDRIL